MPIEASSEAVYGACDPRDENGLRTEKPELSRRATLYFNSPAKICFLTYDTSEDDRPV